MLRKFDFSEKDIDEVLQTHTVFTNVSKGQAAKKDEVIKAFGHDRETDICKEILQKGELQVSEKERQAMLDTQMNGIVTSVAALCVNPETQRPYTVTIIEKALKDAHFSAKTNKNIKQQTLEAIKVLKDTIPLERSRMKLKITWTAAPHKHSKEMKKFKESVQKLSTSIESDDFLAGDDVDEPQLTMTLLIDPGNFRAIDELVRNDSKGKGLVELLELKHVAEGEEMF